MTGATGVKAKCCCLLALLACVGCKSMGGDGGSASWWPYGSKEPQSLGSNSTEVVAALQARKQDSEPSFAQRLWSPIENLSSSTRSSDAPDDLDRRDRLSLDVPSHANPELYCRIAGFAETKGSYNQAKELYQKSLALDPDHLASQLGLARILLRQGEIQASLQQYRQAASDHPDSPLVQNDLGLFYLSQGQLDPARASFERAVSLDPTSRRYRNNLAGILVSEGEYEPAVQTLLAANDAATAYLSVSILARREGAVEVADFYETRAAAEAATLPPTHLARQYFDQRSAR